MMLHVSRDDESHGAYRKRIVARHARAQPCLGRHISEQGNRGKANPPELLDMSFPGDIVGASARRRDVLVVARQRSVEAAGEPERSKRKRALRVADMIQHLPDAPFVRRIPMERTLLRNSPD